ncbi:MAG: UDP-N-acetylmuramoyl-L-alanyl-D-glutamate--2,6-diaminopimelate ligase [Chlamydiota bacterium]|nr:UDP-N-acetylmuramoyl-L-alanyl-D-glutamate--2,6-diaminopimelate ligase [Chlamydiota bacterium]
MKLKELMGSIEHEEIYANPNLEIRGLSYDSRQVRPGDLLFTWSGITFDGHDYLDEARQRGAVGAVVEKPVLQLKGFTQLVVKDPRTIMGLIAKRFYHNVDEKMTLIGVTGTNGKTTVSSLLYYIFNACARPCGLFSTINHLIGERVIPAGRTTPEALDIYRMLDEMHRSGIRHAVVEVSSHALDLGRLEGLRFSAGVFTNLSHDHLDFHMTMERYFEAKSYLFQLLDQNGIAVINRDDPYGMRLLKTLKPEQVIDFGLTEASKIFAKDITFSQRSTTFTLCFPGGTISVKTCLIGQFNVYNILAAFAVVWGLKCSGEGILEAIGSFHTVLGRMQRVDLTDRFSVFVDYAHTPDAMKNVLESLAVYKRAQLVVVFGCGGDRDKAKRVPMGEMAGLLADRVIITSDNPRTEDPEAIMNTIEKGVKKTKTNYCKKRERRDAINYALSILGEGDILLVAGKGHEKFQELMGRMLPFDDEAVIRDCYNAHRKQETGKR